MIIWALISFVMGKNVFLMTLALGLGVGMIHVSVSAARGMGALYCIVPRWLCSYIKQWESAKSKDKLTDEVKMSAFSHRAAHPV